MLAVPVGPHARRVPLGPAQAPALLQLGPLLLPLRAVRSVRVLPTPLGTALLPLVAFQVVQLLLRETVSALRENSQAPACLLLCPAGAACTTQLMASVLQVAARQQRGSGQSLLGDRGNNFAPEVLGCSPHASSRADHMRAMPGEATLRPEPWQGWAAQHARQL